MRTKGYGRVTEDYALAASSGGIKATWERKPAEKEKWDDFEVKTGKKWDGAADLAIKPEIN